MTYNFFSGGFDLKIETVKVKFGTKIFWGYKGVIMTTDEICERFHIEKEVYFLEPSELFNKGIIGVSEDSKHIVYGFYTLAEVLADFYKEEQLRTDPGKPYEDTDFYSDAIDYLEINTVPTVDRLAMNEECYPIIVCEINK